MAAASNPQSPPASGASTGLRSAPARPKSRRIPKWAQGLALSAALSGASPRSLSQEEPAGPTAASVGRPIGDIPQRSRGGALEEAPDDAPGPEAEADEARAEQTQERINALRGQGDEALAPAPARKGKAAAAPPGEKPGAGRRQLAGVSILQLLYEGYWVTFGQTIWLVDAMYITQHFSKFIGQWIPPVGTLFDPIERVKLQSGQAAKPHIGPRIFETFALILGTFFAFAFVLFIVAILALVQYAIQEFCGNAIGGIVCDVFGAIANFF